ncbi:MAG: group 1 glycosyl transferase, partial [Bacteroidota bacterium]
MRIWAFHLFNDYSGSPLMLKNALKALECAEIHLWTSKSEGFLSDLKPHQLHSNSYQWRSNKLRLLLGLIIAQWEAFSLVCKNRKRVDVLYINTLLPVGAAVAGKLFGIPVIYHLHEPQLNNRFLFRLLKSLANWTAVKAIFVSNYLASCFPKMEERGAVIPNVLSESFLHKIQRSPESECESEKENILMLCSFKIYKGIHEFAALANNDPGRLYTLILNASVDQVIDFLRKSM